MATKSDPIIHQAISKASRQIRLLRILSDTSTEDVECSLDVYDIDTAPSYTAISYTWGPVAPVREITINGVAISVRENCHAALQHACLHCHVLSKYLWIDAICIDQENLLEKNHQVGLMAEIFEKANSVLVSLGSEHLGFDHESFQRTFAEQCWTEHEVFCARLLQVSRAPYWSRLWVVQEYLVAPKSRLYLAFGDNLIEDTTLHNLLETIDQYQSKPRLKLHRELLELRTCWTEILQSNMASLSSERHNRVHAQAVESGKQPLEHLLKTYNRSLRADTRDKVFGLLHLVQWATLDMKMHADYTKSVYEVGVDCIRCGVHPALMQDTLQLDYADPGIQNRLQLLSEDASHVTALATRDGLPNNVLQSASAGPCDHRCAKNHSAATQSTCAPARERATDEPHFPNALRVRWFSCNRESGQALSHVNFGLKLGLQSGGADVDELPLVMFAANADIDMLKVAAVWVPWMEYGVRALVRNTREAGVYNMVCYSELWDRVHLEGVGCPSEPRAMYPQRMSSCGLILRGTDHALYMIIGPANKKPVNAIRCNAWLDQPDFKYEQSRFCHIVQACEFHGAKTYGVFGTELPIYMDPGDFVIAVCQDHERLRNCGEKTICKEPEPYCQGSTDYELY